jgi:hypothetical protein
MSELLLNTSKRRQKETLLDVKNEATGDKRGTCLVYKQVVLNAFVESFISRQSVCQR